MDVVGRATPDAPVGALEAERASGVGSVARVVRRSLPSMPSSPPHPGASSRPARVLGAPTGEDVLYAAVEHASPQACRTRTEGGSLSFRTDVSGRVVSADPDGLWLDDAGQLCRAHLILPACLRTTELVGQVLRLSVVHAYAGARVNLDVRIYDKEDRLLLWARDGALPPDSDAPLALRVAHSSESRSRLVLAQGLARAVVGLGWSEVPLEGGLRVWVGKLEPGDVSLLVTRG